MDHTDNRWGKANTALNMRAFGNYAQHRQILMGGSHNLPPVVQQANTVNVSHSCSLRQVLMQTMINLIQEFDSTDPEATIPWLDHI